MAKVYEFLATGFEEIEALIPLDIMRRAGVEFKTVSVTGAKEVESAHGVKSLPTCCLRRQTSATPTCSCCRADCREQPTSTSMLE